MVRLAPSSLVLLCLLIAPGLISGSLPANNNYLHLVEQHRKLQGSDAAPKQQDVCSGEFLLHRSAAVADGSTTPSHMKSRMGLLQVFTTTALHSHAELSHAC